MPKPTAATPPPEDSAKPAKGPLPKVQGNIRYSEDTSAHIAIWAKSGIIEVRKKTGEKDSRGNDVWQAESEIQFPVYAIPQLVAYLQAGFVKSLEG